MRRPFLRLGAPLPLGPLLFLGAFLIAGCGDAPKRPDIVLILVDTLRADHTGVYGYARPTTPELDRFALSSMVFEDVVAAAPWTLPSVASIMTSSHPSVHGLRRQRGVESMARMRPGVKTLAEVLREQGYRTAAVLTNPWVSKNSGLHRGFDEVHQEVMKPAERVNQVARELISSDDPRPLFLYLHYMDVHGPYGLLVSKPIEDLGPASASPARAMSAEELQAIPKYLRIEGTKKLGDFIDAYDQGIRSWDRSFGEFMEFVDTEGRLRDAIVAVIADHGEELLDHGGWSHGGSLYQEQLFVPWIMRVPGSEARRVTVPVSLTDVGPTLLFLAGVAAPATMYGRNALAEGVIDEPRTLFAENSLVQGDTDVSLLEIAARRGDLKFIIGPKGRECFDLASDPGEHEPRPTKSHCGEQRYEDLMRWRAEMQVLGERLGEVESGGVSSEMEQQLREIGYLE